VWDESQAGHVIPGTYGVYLDEPITNLPTLADIEASTVLAKQADLLRALGLIHENHYIDNINYNGSGKMISARIRIYDLAVNVGTAVGVVATYNITSTYVGDALNTYKVVKV